MQLICLGDSLTFGYGVRRSQRWTELAARELGVEVVNCGVNGDTTGGMLARLDRDVLGRCPQLSWRGRTAVLVTGGTNDIFYSGSDVAARSNMGAIVHQLAALGLRVAVGAPLPVAPERTPEGWRAAVDFAGARVALERYRSWLRGFCSGFGVPLVPFDLDFLDGQGAAVPELLLDGIHPGPQGHRRMADRCVTWFRQQMEGR